MYLAALFRQHHVNHAAIILVSFTRHQFFLFQAVNNACQVAHRNHHLRADFSEGKPAGVTDGRQYVKLRRRKAQFLEILLELLVREEAKPQKPDPQARGVA